MILYVENPKDPTKKTPRTDKFSKVAGYKINTQKSVAFLYVTNELSEKETKKTIPFTVASQKTKTKTNPRNLTKDVKDQYSEKF